MVGVAALAEPNGVAQEVSITINGEAWAPPEDSLPFIRDGRTFVPVRGIAEMLDIPVRWCYETRTAHIGELPPTIGLLDAAPAFDYHSFTIRPTILLSDSQVHCIALNSSQLRGGWAWSYHNLDGQFATLTGVVGRAYGWSGFRGGTINFIGDGRELASFGVAETMRVSIDVSGVYTLRIEFSHNGLALASPILHRAGIFRPGRYIGTTPYTYANQYWHTGMEADLTVAVEVSANAIKDITIISHGESPVFISMSLAVICEIIASNGIDSVDTVTDVTFTSYAIIDATRRALEQARVQD
jgi:hypothetical protein